jgi:hypothetical protein
MFDELRRTLEYVEASRAERSIRKFLSSLLAVQLGFRKNYMRDAFIGELSRLSDRSRAVNRPLFSLPLMNLPRLFSKARSDVFEILLDVMMNFKEHLLKFSRGGWYGWCLSGCFGRQRCLLLLYMHRAGMGYLLNLCCAASRTRNKLLFGLLLIILETRKPALKIVFFLAEKIVDHHTLGPPSRE